MEFPGPRYSKYDPKGGIWTLGGLPAFWEGTGLEEDQRIVPYRVGTQGRAPLAQAYHTVSGFLTYQPLSLPNVLLNSTVATLGLIFNLSLLILKMGNLCLGPSATLIPTKYIFICYHSLCG